MKTYACLAEAGLSRGDSRNCKAMELISTQSEHLKLKTWQGITTHTHATQQSVTQPHSTTTQPQSQPQGLFSNGETTLLPAQLLEWLV